MSRPLHLIAAALTLAGMIGAGGAQAAEVRPVMCSVTIDYLRNDVLRASYTKDFVVLPGDSFFDDFSTAIRFGDFTATTRLVGADTVVDISYYNETSVFDTVQLKTQTTLRNGNDPGNATGEHIFTTPAPTSTGVINYVEHTTRYALNCQRFRG